MTDKKRILVVEDEPHIVKLISFILTNEGYEVIHASNGEEGVEVARKELPDLIVLDVMMPKMDGFEAAKAIISNEKTTNIPIIILSSKAQFEDKMKAIDIGVVDYMTKPFDRNQLLTKIREHLA